MDRHVTWRVCAKWITDHPKLTFWTMMCYDLGEVLFRPQDVSFLTPSVCVQRAIDAFWHFACTRLSACHGRLMPDLRPARPLTLLQNVGLLVPTTAFLPALYLYSSCYISCPLSGIEDHFGASVLVTVTLWRMAYHFRPCEVRGTRPGSVQLLAYLA